MKKRSLLTLLLALVLCFSFTTQAAPKLSVKYTKSIAVNTTMQIKPNMACTYKSGNTKIATVSSKGVVKGKKAGTVTITVTAKKNKKLKANLKVTVKNDVVITKGAKNNKVSLAVGKKATLKTNVPCTFSSSAKSIATVSSKGVVTAKASGKATISVKAKKFKKTRKVTVTVSKTASSGNSGNSNVPDSTTETAGCDHVSDNGKVTKAPSCTENGVKTYTCLICKKVLKTEDIKAAGHEEDGGTVTQPSTCSTKGTIIYKCLKCGEQTRTAELDLKSHTTQIVETKAPTCTEEGVKTKKCTVCKAVLETYPIPKIKHERNEGVITVEPTCSTEGVRSFACKNCGCSKGSETWDTSWETTDSWKLYWGVGTAGEAPGAMESTKDYNPNDVAVETIPHTFVNMDVIKRPTCSSTGVVKQKCSVCDFITYDGVLPIAPDVHEGAEENSGIRCICRCGQILPEQTDWYGTTVDKTGAKCEYFIYGNSLYIRGNDEGTSVLDVHNVATSYTSPYYKNQSFRNIMCNKVSRIVIMNPVKYKSFVDYTYKRDIPSNPFQNNEPSYFTLVGFENITDAAEKGAFLDAYDINGNYNVSKRCPIAIDLTGSAPDLMRFIWDDYETAFQNLGYTFTQLSENPDGYFDHEEHLGQWVLLDKDGRVANNFGFHDLCNNFHSSRQPYFARTYLQKLVFSISSPSSSHELERLIIDEMLKSIK